MQKLLSDPRMSWPQWRTARGGALGSRSEKEPCVEVEARTVCWRPCWRYGVADKEEVNKTHVKQSVQWCYKHVLNGLKQSHSGR